MYDKKVRSDNDLNIYCILGYSVSKNKNKN